MSEADNKQTAKVTVREKKIAEYQASRPYENVDDTKLTAAQRLNKAYSGLAASGNWEKLSEAQQKEFHKHFDKEKIPWPIPKWQHEWDLLQLEKKDFRGKVLGTYTIAEWKVREKGERAKESLEHSSFTFKLQKMATDSVGADISAEEVQAERERRQKLAALEGKRVGRYRGDPLWDDVIPIPQDEGKDALAAIAYTDEYAEGMFQSSCFMQAY
jgi:hypothetical protein